MLRAERQLQMHGLTFLQYNALRIIRGAGKRGIAQCDIRERMATPNGDVSRLLSRLESSNLLSRASDIKDKRVLTVGLTAAGAELLAKMDMQLKQLDRQLAKRRALISAF